MLIAFSLTGLSVKLNGLSRKLAPTIPFHTTPEQRAALPFIANEMRLAYIDPLFVDVVSALANDDQGVFDLMRMWMDMPEDRHNIITDLWNSARDIMRHCEDVQKMSEVCRTFIRFVVERINVDIESVIYSEYRDVPC